MLAATASIVTGNILVVVFSSHDATFFTGNDLLTIYATNVAYQVYLLIAFVIFAITEYTSRHYFHSRLVLKRYLKMHSHVEPISFCISSSIVGTQAVLMSKCMAIMIQVTARGIRNEFSHHVVYLTLVAWIGLVWFWIRRLDMGLDRYPPLFIIPGNIIMHYLHHFMM